MQDVPLTIAVFAGLLFCLVIHECAHVLVADWLGDNTARVMGRLTLNPIPHIDPIMTILMPVLSYMSNIPLLGGAKPVPVDMNRLRGNRLTSMSLVALAGPVSNVFLAVLFALAVNPFLMLMQASEDDPAMAAKWEIIAKVLGTLVYVNISLAIFNMLPIPPLDGSRILAAMLPGELGWSIYQMAPVGMIILNVMVISRSLAWLLGAPVRTIGDGLLQLLVFV